MKNESVFNFKKLPLEIYEVDEVSSSVYHIKAAEGQFLLKLNVGNRVLDTPAARILFMMNLPFFTELHYVRLLEECEFVYFRYPRMVHSDGKTYMLFQYIAHKPNQGITYNPNEAVCAISEFQASSIERSVFDKVLASFFSPLSSLLRGILTIVRPLLGINSACKALSVVAKSYLRQRRQAFHLLIHKDLRHDENYLISDEGQMYFIDFASVIHENRWVMLDVIDLAFDTDRMRLRFEMLNEYVDCFHKMHHNANPINLEAQVRIALMRKVAFYMSGIKFNRDKQMVFREFYVKVLLSDYEFHKWMSGDGHILSVE